VCVCVCVCVPIGGNGWDQAPHDAIGGGVVVQVKGIQTAGATSNEALRAHAKKE
jgi:hypothetical protein